LKRAGRLERKKVSLIPLADQIERPPSKPDFNIFKEKDSVTSVRWNGN
jgi:hypothetical protein